MKVTLDESSSRSSKTLMRQIWRKSNEGKMKTTKLANASPPCFNDQTRPKEEKKRRKQKLVETSPLPLSTSYSLDEEMLLLSEPIDKHLQNTRGESDAKIKELQDVVSQLRKEKEQMENKLNALEENVRELNNKNELSEKKSSMLGDTVGQLLEEKRMAEEKTLEVEEKLKQLEVEKELVERIEKVGELAELQHSNQVSLASV